MVSRKWEAVNLGDCVILMIIFYALNLRGYGAKL